MDPEEKKWAEEAIGLCKMASERGIRALFIRKQDQNGAADIVIAYGTAEEIAAMNGNDIAEDIEEE